MGSCAVKPFLIFMCQIGLTFSLWFPCFVTSIEEALLFQYYKIIFLFYSGTFIVLVFVFISPGVYFYVGKDIPLFIFQMESQSSCIY